jgi:TonB-linked SusC/RagA family outer membrane protein
MKTTLGRVTLRWWCLAIAVLAGVPLVTVRAAVHAQGAGGAIVGRVTDARTDLPIPGASVQLEGTQLGGLVAADGRYRIANVPAGTHTVVAQSIGYGTARQQVTVGAEQVTVNLTLQIAPIALDQIVVTGTAGGERLRTLGNSVTYVDAVEATALAAPPTISSLLNARAPGLVINFTTGRLGAGQSIDIRGRSTLNPGSMLGGDAPLIYLDGVRVNSATGTGPSGGGGLSSQGASVAGRLNDIGPEDIERIEVIKGPAAATIYGTEASNGVIQIITKKGVRGARPVFTVQLEQGSIFFRDAADRLPTNYLRDADGNLVAWNAVRQEEERGTPLFRTGHARGIQGSISGGFDQARYYLSSSYDNDDGVEPNNELKQFSLHANVDVTPNAKLDIGTSLHYVDLRNRLGNDQGASTLFGANYGHILLPGMAPARGFYPGIAPEAIWSLFDNTQNVNRFTASSTVNHRPANWFSHRLLAGLDYTGDDSRVLERFATPEIRAVAPGLSSPPGRIAQTLRRSTRFTLDYSGTARADLTSEIGASTSVGLQAFRTESSNSALGGMGFPGAGVETVMAIATPFTPVQTQSLNTTVGAYLQEKLAWRDRLYLTGALRVDNNSAFGEDYQWVTYPKADLAWVVSEEPFWRWSEIVNTLRLRGAYGESGRAPDVFSALQTFSPIQGPGGSNAVTPGSRGNPNLRPERGKELEVGFEAELLRRLSLDFTYYDKNVVDQIVNQPVAPSTGFSGSVPLNLGRVDNSGIELRASLQALDRSNLQWSLSGTLATNKSVIRDLGIVPNAIAAAGTANRVGYPIGGFWARKVLSADRNPTTGQATNVLCADTVGSAGVACATAPFVFLGPTSPTSSGSVSSTLTIQKRLRLFALFDFQRGNVQFNGNELVRCSALLGRGLCEANYNPEDYSVLYLAAATPTAFVQHYIDQYVQDASYVKLREVSATYRLPERWLRGVSDASITLAARELATWTKYRGVDPDVSFTTDQAVLPQLSRLTAILNIKF